MVVAIVNVLLGAAKSGTPNEYVDYRSCWWCVNGICPMNKLNLELMLIMPMHLKLNEFCDTFLAGHYLNDYFQLF